MCGVLNGTNSSTVEITPATKLFPGRSCFTELQKCTDMFRKTKEKWQQIGFFLRQNSDLGELEYQNNGYMTAEGPACAFPLSDLCCISLVTFSSGRLGPSQTHRQNHQQSVQMNSFPEGIIHGISRTPPSSFVAIGVVKLREVVNRKESVPASGKVKLNTEGTFTICMPCYKNEIAPTKGFPCSISYAKG